MFGKISRIYYIPRIGALIMAEDEVWRVQELIDESQPFIQDVKLARQMIETIKSLEEIEEHNVRIPRAAREFADNTLTDWFELIAQIEKKRGNMPYLVDRDLYPGDDGLMQDITWNHRLTLSDVKKWLEDENFKFDFFEQYPWINRSRHITNEPISGYVNRLFPVKFALRILASMTLSEAYDSETEIWDGCEIDLHSLREKCYSVSKYAKEQLKLLDLKIEAGSTTDVRVGLPEDSEKAKERFVAQFVGSKRKHNVTGALFELGFASLAGFSIGPIKHTSSDVLFTKMGWEFMSLENPLIDTMEGWNDYFNTGMRFSDEEIKFLLTHFKKNVPAEWKLIIDISSIIKNGDNRPKSLESKLVAIYNWDKTKASQMRNGALSRMEELDLISRQKEGREVTYFLTERGENILNN